MASFVEALLGKKIDYQEEVCNLEALFNSKHYWPDSAYSYCLSERVNQRFLHWEYRGTYISADSLRSSIGIDRIIHKAKYENGISLDEFVEYLEYLTNILTLVNQDSLDGIKNATRTNIQNCLDSLHYIVTSDENTPTLFRLVPKNNTIEKAIEVTRDEALSELFYQYSHHSSKNNLPQKSMILASIWKKYESQRSKIEHQNTAVASEIGKIANTCAIRHNPTPQEASVLGKLSNSEKEALYDSLFNLYVDAFATLDAGDEIAKAEALLAK